MGEIADDMISGLLCETCGVLIDGDEPGFPRHCYECGGPPVADTSRTPGVRRKRRKKSTGPATPRDRE